MPGRIPTGLIRLTRSRRRRRIASGIPIRRRRWLRVRRGIDYSRMISINWHPTDRELRQFAGIWFPAFWAIVCLLIGSRAGYWVAALLVFGIAAAIATVGLIQPRLMRPIYVAWMCAAFPVGWL